MRARSRPCFLEAATEERLGPSWTACGSSRGEKSGAILPPPHIAHIKGIAIHPEEPEVMYCSIEEGGVIQSLDAGETWRYVSKGEAETFRPVSRATGVYQDCHVVRLSFQDPDSLLVSTGDGLYRSDDCG